MKGLFWNCRGVKKKGLASYVREMLKADSFDFCCVQETMVQDLSDDMIGSVDPNKNYLWDWSPSKGKSGGILTGLRVDSFDVGSRTQGDFILMNVLWDKKLEKSSASLMCMDLLKMKRKRTSLENRLPFVPNVNIHI
jgi:hypothetical protein